jgi:hypothetical protein
MLNFILVQVKVLQSDVYLCKSTDVLKVLEYQEYKSTFSKYCITTPTVLTFMYRNVLHEVNEIKMLIPWRMEKELKVKSSNFHLFTMLLYLTFLTCPQGNSTIVCSIKLY